MVTPRIENLVSFADVGPVALRLLDAVECEQGGFSPESAIARCIHDSYRSFAIYNGDKPLVLWGYMPGAFGGRVVRIWMLTTPEVEECRFWFARKSVELRDFFLEKYTVIEAYVWSGHTPACRWLEWLGFEWGEADPANPEFFFMRRRR